MLIDLSILKKVLVSPHGQVFEYEIQFEFLATNNVSEYEAFLARLGLAKTFEASPLRVQSDS
jgi:ribonuclease HI